MIIFEIERSFGGKVWEERSGLRRLKWSSRSHHDLNRGIQAGRGGEILHDQVSPALALAALNRTFRKSYHSVQDIPDFQTSTGARGRSCLRSPLRYLP